MASWFLLKGNLAVQNQEKILFCLGKRCFIHRSSLRATSERTLSLRRKSNQTTKAIAHGRRPFAEIGSWTRTCGSSYQASRTRRWLQASASLCATSRRWGLRVMKGAWEGIWRASGPENWETHEIMPKQMLSRWNDRGDLLLWSQFFALPSPCWTWTFFKPAWYSKRDSQLLGFRIGLIRLMWINVDQRCGAWQVFWIVL